MKTKVKTLLYGVKTILKHQKEKEILLGESFNIFSVLGLEYDENRTHSSLIAELLNPQGSHHKGNIFLKLFLDAVNYSGELNPDSTKVITEKDIGRINLEEKIGGRIDIFLKDLSGNIISIENKINAGDQDCQIERYCNYDKENNTVYYLTKHGNESEVFSKGELLSGEDYYTISYEEQILNWLNSSYKECSGNPILRETIRQYIILIKNITNIMENKERDELIRLMLNNYEAASFISENFEKIHRNLGEEIRQSVIDKLRNSLIKGFLIEEGSSANRSKFSQIWISLKPYESTKVCFGIESFSGHGNLDGNLHAGIFNNNTETTSKLSNWKYGERWNNREETPVFKGEKVNFSNTKLIIKLINNEEEKMELVEHITNFVLDYIDNNKIVLNNELKRIQ
jgi:hypothetical protein